MAIHSSILAWKIPLTEEPGRLQSMGSQRVGHDLATKPAPLLEEIEAQKVERAAPNHGTEILCSLPWPIYTRTLEHSLLL